MKKFVCVLAVLAVLCVAASASAHGPSVRFVPVQRQFVPVRRQFAGVNQAPVVIQQTTRGAFGRVRSQTTIIGR